KEVEGCDPSTPPPPQTGSHNLVLGTGQSYTSFGAILGGLANTASGPYSFVIGERDTASGHHASVSGGSHNTSSADAASVSGGYVSGGAKNVANGESSAGYNPGPSWVGGGRNNTAEGSWSSVSGGFSNKAVSPGASVSGGEENVAGGGVHGGPGACCYPGTGP